MKKLTTRALVLCALFAALTAICSQLAIPLQPVPINLAMLSVFLAGGLLGGKYGALSQAVYVLLGAVGVPVFQGFRGGLSALTGPTGGYIIGYVLAALVTGWLFALSYRKFSQTPWLCSVFAALSCICGLIVCYGLGTFWYVLESQTAFLPALSLCVVPFLPGDAAKILVAALLLPRLKKTVGDV